MRLIHPLLAAALILPAAGLAQAPQPVAEDPVVARVDGTELRLSDVMATAQDVLPADLRNMPPALLLQVLPPQVRQQLTERAITERALTAAARTAGLDRDEEVQRRIRRAEAQELQQAYLSREVMAQVTDAALRARYDQEMTRRRGEEEVRARHILVRTEAEARTALAALARGEDFAELAKRISTDPGARDGGDLGFFKRGDMVPEFAEAAFALQPGQVSPAPVRTNFGFHVIKVEARRTAPTPSFEEAREQLRQQMTEEQVEAVVQRVRGTARIERLEQPPAASGLLDGAAPPAAAPPGRAAPPQRR